MTARPRRAGDRRPGEPRSGGRRQLPLTELALVAIMLVGGTAVHAARTVVSYRALAVGADTVAIGVIAAAFAALPLLVAIWTGRQADRGRSGSVLLAGGFCTAAGCLALALAADVPTLAAGSALLGLGHLWLLVGSESIVAHGSSANHQDWWFGWLTATASLNQLVGPLGAGLLIEAGGVDGRLASTANGLLIGAAIAALAVPLAWWVWRRVRTGRATPARDSRVPMRQVVGAPGVRVALFAGMALTVCIDILIIYLPVLGEERGMPPSVVGALLAVRACTSLATRLGTSLALRLVRRIPLVVGSLVIPGLVLAVVPFTTDYALLVVIMAVAGVTLGLGTPLSMTWLVQIAPARSRGTALALRLMVNRIGIVAIPLGAGALAAATGAGAAFLLLSGLLVAAGTAVVPRWRTADALGAEVGLQGGKGRGQAGTDAPMSAGEASFAGGGGAAGGAAAGGRGER
ncbi:MFS transporter [Phytohabitans kaempferiae]|uniref:MFS transporter n=1 Tax=Phytohabitans kaempferiae TaxID=1620943 RepID=A0ABV6MH36_9ACTN